MTDAAPTYGAAFGYILSTTGRETPSFSTSHSRFPSVAYIYPRRFGGVVRVTADAANLPLTGADVRLPAGTRHAEITYREAVEMNEPTTGEPSRPASCLARLWSAFRRQLAAETQAPDRTGLRENKEKLRYLQSWMLLRLMIGVCGLALAPVTWLCAALLPQGHWAVQPSLSAYYYSGMRDFFTCTLTATGVFLMAYKAFEQSLENVITAVAGFSIVLVSFFPTARPEGYKAPLTPVQSALGEDRVGRIHTGAAIAFVVLLAAISLLFGFREGSRARPDQKWLHWGCALGILLACTFFVVQACGADFGSWIDGHSTWLTEVVAVVAFGTSWTVKGSELRKLGRVRAPHAS